MSFALGTFFGTFYGTGAAKRVECRSGQLFSSPMPMSIARIEPPFIGECITTNNSQSDCPTPEARERFCKARERFYIGITDARAIFKHT